MNNYPIGSFLIVGGLDRLVHDLLLSGRIVSGMSFAAIGLLGAIATRSFGGDRVDGVFAAACVLGFCYLVAPAWIMVDDPQTLGEAVMLGALVVYRSGSRHRLGLLLAALLVVSGGFIKHNLIAIPLAITLDLGLRSPRKLLFWLGSCAGFAAVLLGLTQLVAGGAFIEHLLSPRNFTWYGSRYHAMKYLRLFKFPLIAITVFSPWIFTGRRIVLAAWGALSIAAATVLSGFEGTSYNTFQDAAVFLGIAAGVLFCELRKRICRREMQGRLAAVVFGAPALVLAQPIFARSPDAFRQVYNVRTLLDHDRNAQREFLSEARFIAERPGPAICESLLLCYTAGKPFILDPFNSRQYILAGRLDQRELIRRIAAHEFAVIQLRGDICDDPTTKECHILHSRRKFNRFTDETLYAIDRYYQIARRSQDGTFYVAK
ncbi:MAG: hypothetical protein J2P48_05150 [Alphaproteobacteria bacterium]|nr:hypothetical protein [Alphaproteobacteria bacterium]